MSGLAILVTVVDILVFLAFFITVHRLSRYHSEEQQEKENPRHRAGE